MISSLLAAFVGLTGITPQKIEALGIELQAAPASTFYIFGAVIVLFHYWSYRTLMATDQIVSENSKHEPFAQP
jgi:hypothetical protein